MKRILYILWSGSILICILFIGFKYLRPGEKMAVSCSAIQLIDTLSKNDADISLLTIVHEGCTPCEILLDNKYYKQLNLPKIYVDKLTDNNIKLLTQALYTKGFPTTYIIGPDFEVLANIEGVYNFESKLKNFLGSKKGTSSIKICHVEQDSVLKLMSLSFKALYSYWKNDTVQMKKYALQSLDKGSYFFNNYTMYQIYKCEHKMDSALLYKQKALIFNNHDIDTYIYDNLIDTLQMSVP